MVFPRNLRCKIVVNSDIKRVNIIIWLFNDSILKKEVIRFYQLRWFLKKIRRK